MRIFLLYDFTIIIGVYLVTIVVNDNFHTLIGFKRQIGMTGNIFTIFRLFAFNDQRGLFQMLIFFFQGLLFLTLSAH